MERIVAAENLTLLQLGAFFGNHDTEEEFREANRRGIMLLENLEILPTKEEEKTCPTCQAGMSAITDRTRTLGWRYRCNGPVKHRMEPTANTFVDHARVNEIGSFRIIILMYSWLIGMPVTSAQVQVQVGAETAMAWYKYCRDVATKIAWHDLGQIGGPGDVVEIDETHLFKRKYHVGRRTMWEHHWLFGGISRATKKRFGVMVPAYGILDTIFEGHGTVNHSTNFLQPPLGEDPIWVPTGTFLPECLDKNWIGPPPRENVQPFRIHTNNAKRSWRELKSILTKCNGLQVTEGYIGEWMYRKNILDENATITEKFFRFCNDVARAYPGIGKNPMQIDIENCNCHECEE
ncbi:hypothetical protein RN001_011823 [Aquatica leii]|uniref:Transposase n=1 Tax=Aquatica leii TaxID=1421715 RepID=A0AAN7S7J7_9COLE|nr:hypothetical protein RN001_011823 [Aquatica leii]